MGGLSALAASGAGKLPVDPLNSRGTTHWGSFLRNQIRGRVVKEENRQLNSMEVLS